MKIRGKTLAHEAIFQGRIYFIFLAVAFHCLRLNASFGQEIGSYRTIASGNFGNTAIWQVYDGAIWQPATVKPGQANDIYIDQTHLLTLTGNEEVKSVFINAETGAGQKLNLNGNNLDVYGTLQAFSGAAPGLPSGTWNSQNWIGNSISSTITFRGSSRVIIPKDSWSGFTTQSRYTVIIDPGAGSILTIEEPAKAVRFILRSGALFQKLDTSVTPNFCPSLSFNTETAFYPAGAFGDFIIEPNGTFISDCNSNIIARSISGSVSAGLFDLQEGAELILEGVNPSIEAAAFQLDGKVIFRGGSSTKSVPCSTFADAQAIGSFHDMEIQGTQNVQFPSDVTITGSISKTGTGFFLTGTSHITFSGNYDQTISGFPLTTLDLTVNKSGGTVLFEQDLAVLRNLAMVNGELDFQDNQLTLNTSNAGTYAYSGGSWEKLSTLTFANVPTNLTASNATFPFGDRYHGGIRKVQLLGTSAGGNLSINYTEYIGADFNPGFNDLDATPILYRLFSHFQFSGLSPSANPLELRISADKLIVDEPEDLRLVCTGYAAPGSHFESTDAINLWAIRSLTFDDLPGKNFTVGSFRTLSILPVTWLSLSAKSKETVNQISWSVAQEKDNKKFEIYRSTGSVNNREKIGETLSKGDSAIPVSYFFTDVSSPMTEDSFYQIRQVDFSGNWAWSPVVRLEINESNLAGQLSISPNPHSQGKIRVNLPQAFNSVMTKVTVYTVQGDLVFSSSYDRDNFSGKLEALDPGLYLVTFSSKQNLLQTKWIKQ